MKILITTLLILQVVITAAQTTADFESFNIENESFLNGSDGAGVFFAGNIGLVNNYNTDWDSWTGWAISNTTDTTTPGFTNQYSCISGSGVNNSETYAVGYVVGESYMYTTNAAEGGAMDGFYLNNSTYSYLSMLNGDSFAKKFGGEDGTDPDYFYVTIKEHGRRNVSNDSINIFLADFRFDDPEEDYILDEWTYVDLSSLTNIDTLSFTMHSSDVGGFGINTPTYFCIDDVTTADVAFTSTEEELEAEISFFPNPVLNELIVESQNTFTFSILNVFGQVVMTQKAQSLQESIDLSHLNSGQYLLKLENNQGLRTIEKFIKS